jgi:hypothetical protein
MTNKPSFFWASYADLMTSLFFIMLVLFVLTVVMLKRQAIATEEELRKIKEIQESVNKIDTTYFAFNNEFKKHILKINVEFNTGSADISNIPIRTRDELVKAGRAIHDSIYSANKKFDAKYLLVIEGQSSNDGFSRNYELSYQRALSLVRLWSQNNVFFNDGRICEILIAGSGASGALRAQPDDASNKKNQCFLIHIIPKPGIFKK